MNSEPICTYVTEVLFLRVMIIDAYQFISVALSYRQCVVLSRSFKIDSGFKSGVPVGVHLV